MELTDFAKGNIWGIRPEVLTEMQTRLPDVKKAVEDEQSSENDTGPLTEFMSMGGHEVEFVEKPEARHQFQLTDGVGIVPVSGPLTKRRSFFSYLFGGSGYNILSDIFNAALADHSVRAILLDIDSPGGTISGTEAFGDMVYEARKVKPVVAFANGCMLSAAYWVGSGARKIITERSADMGSIGVATTHYDWSKNDAQYGLKRTILFAGKYKALGSDTGPLSDTARKEIQSRLDTSYNLFVDTVARNRKQKAAYVREYMAEGKIFIGQQAVDVGLADKTGSMETALDHAQKLIKGSLNISPSYSMNIHTTKEVSKMEFSTVEQLTTACPDLVKKIQDASHQLGVESVDTQAVAEEARTGESTRILGLVEIQFGADATAAFNTVVETGVTIDQFKAIKGTAPETPAGETPEAAAINTAKGEMLAAIQNNAADNPGANNGVLGGDKDFMTLVQAHMAANNVKKGTAIMAVAKTHPKEHDVYLQSMNSQTGTA